MRNMTFILRIATYICVVLCIVGGVLLRNTDVVQTVGKDTIEPVNAVVASVCALAVGGCIFAGRHRKGL